MKIIFKIITAPAVDFMIETVFAYILAKHLVIKFLLGPIMANFCLTNVSASRN